MIDPIYTAALSRADRVRDLSRRRTAARATNDTASLAQIDREFQAITESRLWDDTIGAMNRIMGGGR